MDVLGGGSANVRNSIREITGVKVTAGKTLSRMQKRLLSIRALLKIASER